MYGFIKKIELETVYICSFSLSVIILKSWKIKRYIKKKNHAEILRIKSLSKFHKKIFANYLLIEFIRTFAKSATQNKNTCINTAFHSFPLMHSLLYTRTQIVRNVHPAQGKRKWVAGLVRRFPWPRTATFPVYRKWK